MATQSAGAAAGDCARHFDVTADASGDFVVRAVASPGCAHHASSDMPRAGREVSPRTPPDLAFIPAHISIGRAEDCDAHLRAFLGTLRRLGPAGRRVGATRDEKQASPETSTPAGTPADARGAAERVERLSETERVERVPETERVPDTERGVAVDSQTRRVPETEFPDSVKCSLPAPEEETGADEEALVRGTGATRAARRSAAFADSLPLPDVPSLRFDEPEDPREPRDASAAERVPESPFPDERLGGRAGGAGTFRGEELSGPAETQRCDAAVTPAPKPAAMPAAMPAATPAATSAATPRSRATRGRPATAAKTPLCADTPYAELRLTADGLFSPASETVARAPLAATTINGPPPSGGPLMNPRGGSAAAPRRVHAFTYPSPAAATPATAPRAHPGRSPLAPPPVPGSVSGLADAKPRSTPGEPRRVVVGNLTARELVPMPTRGCVSIRTAAEAETEAEARGNVEADPRRIEGGGPFDDDPRLVAGDDAGNAVAASETVRVLDTFAVDDVGEPFESEFAFHGGSEEPVPSPAAMAVDRASSGDRPSNGKISNADPKTPKTGGLGGFAAGGGFDDTAGKPAASRFLDDSAAKAKAPTSAFGGFSTGSGKAVEVSAEAMSKAAAILEGGERPKTAATAPAPARFVSPETSPAPAPRSAAAAPAPTARRAAAPKSTGFQSPMLAGAPRTALGKRRLDVGAGGSAELPRGAVSASRFQKQHIAPKASGAASVHDLFASRGARRESYAAFFRGLAPRERLPSRGSPHSRERLDFVSSDVAAGFRVVDAEGRTVGARELRRRMLGAGCVARLLDADWVRNAYRWVVWHHVCVARSFPEAFTDGVLTASAVEQRLLYRYERETLRASRPFLRRVWERDARSDTPAVLVVAAVRRLPPSRPNADAEDPLANGAELELSDGWYGVPARCDAATTRLVRSGALRVGQKILVQGLELLPKDSEPASPLADEALDSWLALRRNQSRPAPWDAKLGARPASAAFPLRSIDPRGGAVKKVLLHVERVYPFTWREERASDGVKTHRSELAEKRAARAWEEARAAALERLAETFARERSDSGSGPEAGPRPEDAEARARGALEAEGLLERRVQRVAKLRVSGVRSTARAANGGSSEPPSAGSALLTVYDLDEDAAARLAASEGATFEVTNVHVAPARERGDEGGFELSTTRGSRWRLVAPSALARANLAPNPKPRRLATTRHLAADASSADDAAVGVVRFGEEFDCVAAVVRVARATPHGAPFAQWVFLADASVARGLDAGFERLDDGFESDTELLAVETRASRPDAFVDAEAWGAGVGFVSGATAAAVVPVALENLTYVRRDAANGVRVAAFTERSRATPFLEGGGAARRAALGPFGSGPNAPHAAREARALRRRFGGDGGDAKTATRLRDLLLARVRALTGSAEESPGGSAGGPEAADEGAPSARRGVPARRASLRRKRSLSLGSEAEWGASQLDVIEAVEAKALEARRRRGAETR